MDQGSSTADACLPETEVDEAMIVKLELWSMVTLITRLTVEYDLDPLPVAVAQAHNMLKRLRAMDIDVDVAETVSLRTGLVLPVPYNDNQVVPASRLGARG